MNSKKEIQENVVVMLIKVNKSYKHIYIYFPRLMCPRNVQNYDFKNPNM